MDDKSLAQKILWESAEPYLFGYTFETWLEPVQDWEFGVSRKGEEVTGAYMVSPEGEIHIHVLKPGYGITRKQYRELLTRYGRLWTRTPKWMDTGVALRLGFNKFKQDEWDNFYEVTLCQQSQ